MSRASSFQLPRVSYGTVPVPKSSSLWWAFELSKRFSTSLSFATAGTTHRETTTRRTAGTRGEWVRGSGRAAECWSAAAESWCRACTSEWIRTASGSRRRTRTAERRRRTSGSKRIHARG